MQELLRRRITVAVTGGIAAYKSCELVRLLKKAGAEVRVVMTENAARFVTPLTFEALSGKPVFTSEWEQRGTVMPHIQIASESELLIVAPATANTIAKAANGIADDLLSTLLAARRTQTVLAPAMNEFMWRSPANQRNLKTAESDGFLIWGPDAGYLACGDTGPGRMIEPSEILERTVRLFREKTLAGKKVLITAGPTFEPLDPVRGITNLSSGRQGFAIAEEAARAGASVTLVAGPCALRTPLDVERIDVQTAAEMRSAVMQRASGSDIFIGVAAVSDWRPDAVSPRKMKKTSESAAPEITLVQNPDILSEVGHLPADSRPFTAGFAAETEDLEENARRKLLRKNADLIAGNLASDALNAPDNELLFVTRDGAQTSGRLPKSETAAALIRIIASRLSLKPAMR